MRRTTIFSASRHSFHKTLLTGILRTDSSGVPSNADKDSVSSVRIASGILECIGVPTQGARVPGQMAGSKFEEVCLAFIKTTFLELQHLRPGKWDILRGGSRNRLEIAKYEQYAHLVALDLAAKKDPELAAALGSDYTITPDIIISRQPEPDELINKDTALIDDSVSQYSSLRKKVNQLPILHASISCKWTIRSDRAQNARSEALNLIRNRKGSQPHIMVVTGEPLPSRIASLALGTGDIDCVYHFALPELLQATANLGMDDALDLLHTMVNGKRLKDISDLPLDLAV